MSYVSNTIDSKKYMMLYKLGTVVLYILFYNDLLFESIYQCKIHVTFPKLSTTGNWSITYLSSQATYLRAISYHDS